ncbi:hypothetical protein [Candidatus Minimicrobia naudis]
MIKLLKSSVCHILVSLAAIAKAAELGDPHAFHLPIAKLSGEYDFSFSGLKTAVLRAVQREVGKDFHFSFS